MVESKSDELINAVFNKGPEEVANVLNKLNTEGVEIKVEDLHFALLVATFKGYLDVVKVLLEYNAEIKKAMTEDMLVLQRNCGGGNVEIFELMMKKGLKLDKCESFARNTDALHIAANEKSEKIVQLLLDNGLKVEETNRAGMTALHIAAGSCNEKIMNLFLDRRANIEAKSNRGQTAVFSASASGRENNVKLLIERGAKIDVADNEGDTCLKFAVESGNEILVKLLLDCGADINSGIHSRSNPLWIASNECSEAMIQLLLDRGAVIYEFDGENSILHNACKQGFETIVKQLIERGANIQSKSEEGQTVLHAAVKGRNESIVKLILDLGLDVNGRDKKGLTPLHCAAIEKEIINLIAFLASRGADINAKDESGATALYYATSHNREEAVKCLLEHGTNIEVSCTSYTSSMNNSFYWPDEDFIAYLPQLIYLSCLHIAVEKGYKPIVELFLNHGIDVNTRGENNITPLHIASVKGRTAIVKLLLDRGADTALKTSSQNESAALHFACANKHIDIVKLLVDSGANINNQDKKGYSALFIAIREQNRELIRILLDNGANAELEDNSKYTPLLYAILKSRKEFNKELSKRRQNDYYPGFGDFYWRDSDGCPCGIVEQLLDHGVNIGASTLDERPTTALQYAIDHKDGWLTELLLNYKADINKVTLNDSLDRTITEHVVKMLSKREFVGDDVLNLIKGNVRFSELREECEKEIERMKSERIGDSAILFYDLLTSDNPCQLAAFMRNESVLQSLKSDEHTKFPLYYSTLNCQVEKGLYRKWLLGKVQGFFHAVADIEENSGLPKLPVCCTSQIFNYLRNGDLRKLIRVCNIKLDKDICVILDGGFPFGRIKLD